MIATALVAVLALSVGALAYPVVVGNQPLSLFHSGTPATVTHPKTGDDNSTGNQTNENETGDHQAPTGNDTENETADNDTADNETAPVPPTPDLNETENETAMGNVTVTDNVTEAHSGTTTWVNGTIMVEQNGTTLADFTFQIVTYGNGTINVTFSGSQVVGSETVSAHGIAVYSPMEHTVDVFGVADASSNGSVLWQRTFAFDMTTGYSHY